MERQKTKRARRDYIPKDNVWKKGIWANGKRVKWTDNNN